jgi:hypothetical protein
VKTREQIEDMAATARVDDMDEDERIVELQHLILDVLLDIRDILDDRIAAD